MSDRWWPGDAPEQVSYGQAGRAGTGGLGHYERRPSHTGVDGVYQVSRSCVLKKVGHMC